MERVLVAYEKLARFPSNGERVSDAKRPNFLFVDMV